MFIKGLFHIFPRRGGRGSKKPNFIPRNKCMSPFGNSFHGDGTPAAESAETEPARYLDNHDRANNPLMFFKDKQTTFPRLCKIVPQIMCAPGSTAAVERVFSVAGYILSPKRMSLSDENFENQLFSNLNCNVFQVRSNKLKLQLNDSFVINSGN